MSEDLLIIKHSKELDMETRSKLAKSFGSAMQHLGLKAVFIADDMSAVVDRNYGPRMDAMLAEQRRTNELLAALVDAMADDAGESDDDIDTGVYLDGLPRG